jgi:hypothetical protein
MSLVLPGWYRCTIVEIAVDVLIYAWCWSLICLLPWTPVSIVPILTTNVAQSHHTSILCIVVLLQWRRCRARRLKVGALNLSLRSLKSLCCNLHTLLLTRMEDRSLRRRTIMEPLVVSLSSSVLHLSLSFHNFSSVFKSYSPVHHVLKVDKIMGLICIHVIRSIMG